MVSVSVGVIGPGLAFQDLHLPALQGLADRTSIEYVAASSRDRSVEAVDRLWPGGGGPASVTVEDLLASDVDVVLVAVPIELTSDTVARVIGAGKHVLAEKPLAMSAAEATQLARRADEQGVALLAGENFRLQPDFRRVRDLVGEGVVGEPRLYFLNDLHFTPADGKYAQTSWRRAGRHEGGYLIDGGTHIVAGMREMVGEPVVQVHAVGAATQPYLSQQTDSLLMNLTFANGMVGHLALGYGVYDQESRHPKIYGTEATLALMPDGIYRVAAQTELVAGRSGVVGFGEEWDVLLDAVVSGDHQEARRLTLESIKDLELIEAAMRSAREGSAVSLA